MSVSIEEDEVVSVVDLNKKVIAHVSVLVVGAVCGDRLVLVPGLSKTRKPQVRLHVSVARRNLRWMVFMFVVPICLCARGFVRKLSRTEAVSQKRYRSPLK